MNVVIFDATVVSRGDGWLSAWVGPEFVMMSADTGTCISLSETGGRVWELMEQPRSVQEICATLEMEYEAPPSAIHTDVMAFLEKLQRESALKMH